LAGSELDVRRQQRREWGEVERHARIAIVARPRLLRLPTYADAWLSIAPANLAPAK
jgi:hypothetical protein